MADMINVGIIGAGLQGKRRARALQQFDDVRLAAVADVNYRAAVSLADSIDCTATATWQDIIFREDIGIVIVCTPPSTHATITIEALERGKNVLCEKPLGRTVEEAEMMVEAAFRNGAKLKCGFNIRHHRGIQQAKGWVEEGTIGDPMFMRVRYGIGGRMDYEKDWRMNPEISGGGQLMDQGMHVLDLARWFLGDFQQVFACLQTAYWNTAPVEDNAFVLLRTKQGQVASLHASWTEWKNLFSLELFGKDGYVIAEGLGGSYGVETAKRGSRDFLAPFAEQVIEFRGEDVSWQEEWKEFVSAIREGREPLSNGSDGLKALRLAEAAYDSFSSGCAISLEELKK